MNPASHSVPPANGKEPMMSDTSGPTSAKQFAFYDPDTRSWRMWPAIGLWGSIEYSGTWPKTGCMSGGRAFELPTSAPPTTASGSSSSSHLPTPTASDGDRERNNPSQARRKSPPLSAISAHFPETDEPNMPVPPKADPQKFCTICGAEFFRKRFNGRLEDRTRFLSRKTCGQACGNSRTSVQVDSHRWRARHAIQRTQCRQCQSTENLHVHHKDRNPANNDPANLEVLCASCHLKLHWTEDRELRMSTHPSRGGVTQRRFADGKAYLDGPPRRPLNSIASESPA